MDVSGGVLTGLAILLLSFTILFGTNKVTNPTFQQYKSIFFVIGMLVTLGTLGLPFMPSDIAHTPPTFYLFFTALSVIVLFGAIFIYVLNLSFDGFVVFVAVVTSLTTILGRLKGQGPPTEGSETNPIVKELFISVSVLAALFGSEKLASRIDSTNPRLQQFLTLWSYFVPVAMMIVVLVMGFRSVKALLDYRTSNTSSPPVPAGKRPFEGFQGAPASAPGSAPATRTLSARLDAALARAQTTMDLITEYADSTCSIIREVEAGYLGAKSAPKDESEVSLPKEVQEERRKARLETAKKSFVTLRKINASSLNTTVLECFQGQGQGQNGDGEEDTIREYCIQLEGLLENAESMAQIARIQSISAELAFADRMIRKSEEPGKEGFQDAPSPSDSLGESLVKKYHSLSGSALTSAAEALLQKEAALFTSVEDLDERIQFLEGKIKRTNQKAAMAYTGDYDKSSKEIQEADLRLSSVKPK
jgi:hypothetical protein